MMLQVWQIVTVLVLTFLFGYRLGTVNRPDDDEPKL